MHGARLQIKVLDGANAAAVAALAKHQFSIGGGVDSDIVLDDEGVRRNHLRLRWTQPNVIEVARSGAEFDVGDVAYLAGETPMIKLPAQI